MKKTLAVLAALGIFGQASFAAVPQATNVPTGKDANNSLPSQLLPNLSFIGAIPFNVTESIPLGSNSTAGWSLATGLTAPLLVYGVCVTGGTFGNYSVLFDSIAGNNLLDVNSRGTTALNSTLISPSIYTQKDSLLNNVQTGNGSTIASNGGNAVKGCWIPPVPVQVINGLVVAVNATQDHSTTILYRPLTGVTSTVTNR